ncbi:MAG TPA: nuclear transport factor 2 family protein [Acidimicrobiia bacterium]|nr:nuclear transport factor 2 family protein [Acidimicrobiia bacterium]
MEEREVRDLFSRMFEHMSAEEEHELRHPDFVMEMPQSGERIRGREKMRSMQESYPGPPSIQLRRVVGADDVWAIEAQSDYDGRVYHVVVIVEFRDGKIVRETRYYADPFDAPEWRAQWVETMEGA